MRVPHPQDGFGVFGSSTALWTWSTGRAGVLVGLDGREVRLCDPCVRVRPCVPCVSRAPPGVFLPVPWILSQLVSTGT